MLVQINVSSAREGRKKCNCVLIALQSNIHPVLLRERSNSSDAQLLCAATKCELQLSLSIYEQLNESEITANAATFDARRFCIQSHAGVGS